MKIAPGVRLSVSKSTLGLSFGVPGARVSMNTRGDVYRSVGIPGSGLYDVKRSSVRSKRGRTRKPKPGEFKIDSPPPGFFAPKSKKALFRAVRDENVAAFESAANEHPDIKYVAMALSLPLKLKGTTKDSADFIDSASEIWNQRANLESDPLFIEYAKNFEATIIIAPGVAIPMQYGIVALGLIYVELLQLEDRYPDALLVAESLPANQATALALAECELQLLRWPDVLETTEDIENIDDATALLLIYRAIALRETGLLDAAIETLRLARSSRSRHEDVLNKALFERAICYEKSGKAAKARKDFEKIMATDSDFPGVAEALKRLALE
jgi:tetratricopeptide (TPR) repeat protein